MTEDWSDLPESNGRPMENCEDDYNPLLFQLS